MLLGIGDALYEDALTVLRWLAYVRSPPSLGELVEASIIDPAGKGSVEIEERGGLEDTLDILSGLVTSQGVVDDDYNGYFSDGETEEKREGSEAEGLDDKEKDVRCPRSGQRLNKDTRVRLAHYSVKEYLESERIIHSDAKGFYLQSAKEHRYLAESCLTYLMHYSCSKEKTSTEQDLIAFPLLEYAARSWFYHSSLEQSGKMSREASLLTSEDAKHDWLLIHTPDSLLFERPERTGTGLYYASFLGLDTAVQELLRTGADVNAQGRRYANALQAALLESHEKVVKILIDGGAEVNAQGGQYGNALQAASSGGREKMVKMLMDAGADVNAQGGHYGNALAAASEGGHEKVISMLMERGADVNAQGGAYGNALQAASEGGHEKVVKMLTDSDAHDESSDGLQLSD